MTEKIRLLTVTEAAERKHCTRKTIYNWIARKLLDIEWHGLRRYIVQNEKFEKMERQGAGEYRALLKKMREAESEISSLKEKIASLATRIERLENGYL